MTVTDATPLELGAGVNVSVPFAAMDGWLLKSPLRLLPTKNVTVCPTSSTGPVTMFVVKLAMLVVPEFSKTVRSGVVATTRTSSNWKEPFPASPKGMTVTNARRMD